MGAGGDVRAEVANRAADRRRRGLFPAGVATGHSDAEQHFGVVRRPVAAPPEAANAPESPVAYYPQKTFTDLSDGESGLMIANRGLAEYEVMTEEDGTATPAVTPVRWVGWLSRDDLSMRRGRAGPGNADDNGEPPPGVSRPRIPSVVSTWWLSGTPSKPSLMK